MEKLIITKHGRVVNFGTVQTLFTKTVNVFPDDNAERKVTPFAVFAIMENDEIVHIGSFSDMDIAEIIVILLDVFSTDRKEIFNVILESYSIGELLEALRYVTGNYYPNAVESLKISLANGDFDVSCSV